MKIRVGNRQLYEAVKLLNDLPQYAEFVEAVIESHKGNKSKLDKLADKVTKTLDQSKQRLAKISKD